MDKKLTPKMLLEQIKEIEVHCQILRKEAEAAIRQHRRLKNDNKLYSPIAYHTFQIAIHNDLIRRDLVKTQISDDTILANGTKLTW